MQLLVHLLGIFADANVDRHCISKCTFSEAQAESLEQTHRVICMALSVLQMQARQPLPKWMSKHNRKTLAPWKKSYDTPRQHIIKQRHHFADKDANSQRCAFSSSHVWMCELDHKEGWVPKNWCFWIVVLEKTLESSLDCKVIKPVHPKGNQAWIFTGRADAEAPILWPPDAKNWLIWKDPDAGKDWSQEEKGTTQGEMVGWHHRLNGREFSKFGSWWWTGRLQSMGS